MKQIRTALLSSLGLACLLFTVAAQADPAALKQKLDAVIDRSIAENHLVGTVVLVARDGKLVYQRAAGLADKKANKPMRLDTLFRLSSVSKPIVTVAALELVEQKKLSLDDAVTKWLPDFTPKLVDGTAPKITIRQLLTHTAGLGYKFTEDANGPYHRAKISDGFDEINIDLAEELHRLSGVPLLSAPGTEWRYSLAIDVLGAVIERVTKKPLGAAIADLVTKPLAMTGTSFVVDPAHAARVATPYIDAPAGPIPMTDPQTLAFGPMTLVYSPARAFDPQAYPSAGAGMIGSATDLLKLLDAVRKGGAPVLTSATAGEMFHNQIAELPGMQPGAGFGFGGAVVVDPAAAKTPQSKGTLYWGGVYGHTWFVDPEKKLTVIVFTNTAPTGMAGPFPDGVRDAVYGAL